MTGENIYRRHLRSAQFHPKKQTKKDCVKQGMQAGGE